MKLVEHWENLGTYLDLPDYKLKEISVDLAHKGTPRQRSGMIDCWLRYDTSPSWEKLCKALDQIDERRLACEIHAIVRET